MHRSKYILDPSVKSSAAFGQSYVPPPQMQTFGSQQNTYGNPLQPVNNHSQQFNQFNNQQFNANPIPVASPSVPPSILNPPPISTFAAGTLPPIEVAQQAVPQQQIQRNPTPPPGWNDPPALKSRAVGFLCT